MSDNIGKQKNNVNKFVKKNIGEWMKENNIIQAITLFGWSTWAVPYVRGPIGPAGRQIEEHLLTITKAVHS